MKKRFMSFIMVVGLAVVSLFANDYVTVSGVDSCEYHDHDTYEVWYDVAKKSPAVVIWDLTASEALLSDSTSDRWKGTFFKCGSSAFHDDYTKSGYDRGHMCPNNDRDFTFEDGKATFKMCNVCPQTPKLNRGSWKKYEAYGHKLAARYKFITIVCGPIYDGEPSYIKGKIAIPTAFFKVFLYGKGKIEAYVFNQDGTVREVSLKEISSQSGLSFNITTK